MQRLNLHQTYLFYTMEIVSIGRYREIKRLCLNQQRCVMEFSVAIRIYHYRYTIYTII